MSLTESSTSTRSWLLAVLTLLVVAAGLRFYAIDFGAPCAGTRPDEELIIREAFFLLDGSRLIHFTNYPPGMMLLEAGWMKLWETMGWLPEGQMAAYAEDPMPFHVSVRVLSALLGTLTVLLIAAATRRLAGDRAGLAAGAVLAVVPLHVLNSHFATLDVPGTFFIALALYLCTGRKGTFPSRVSLLTAAFVSGIAAGFKYPFGAVAIIPLCTALLRWRGPLLQIQGGRPSRQTTEATIRLIFAMGVALLFGFCLAAPTFFFQTAEALGGINKEIGAQQYSRKRWAGNEVTPLRYHIEKSLIGGSSPVVVVAALIGLLLTIKFTFQRGCADLRLGLHRLVMLIPLLVLLTLHGSTGNIFTRYMVPVMPIVALFAGLSIKRFRGRGYAIALGLLLALPLYQSVMTNRQLGRKDTRGELVEKIRTGELPRLPILIPSYPFVNAFPGAWMPMLMGNVARLRSVERDGRGSLPRVAQAILAEEAKEKRRPQVIVLDPVNYDGLMDKFQGRDVLVVIPTAFTKNYYSWWEEKRQYFLKMHEEINWPMELVLHLQPNGDRPFPARSDYDPHDHWYLPFPDSTLVERSGPEIRVYKIRVPGVPRDEDG